MGSRGAGKEGLEGFVDTSGFVDKGTEDVEAEQLEVGEGGSIGTESHFGGEKE